MTEDERIDLLGSLIRHPGWAVLRGEIQQVYNREYLKLRKCKRDNTFYKIQGFLDAVERILQLPDELIGEHRVEIPK